MRPNDADPPPLSPDWELWFAEDRAQRGGAVTGEELAALIEAVGPNPLPDWLRKRVCARLRGEDVKLGRPRKDAERQDQILDSADLEYRWRLHYLRKRAARRTTRPVLRRAKKSCFDRPPRELAAALAFRHCQRKLHEFRHINLPHFRNLLWSAHKKG